MIDTKLRQELDFIRTQMDLEDTLEEANEELVISELLDLARMRGDNYGQGYYEGFFKGRELLLQYQLERSQSIKAKHNELDSRWGLDNL